MASMTDTDTGATDKDATHAPAPDEVAARTGGKQLLAGGSVLAVAMVLAHACN